jgi:hypothetical protein
MIGGRITELNLRIQQLEEEKEKLESEIADLTIEGIDQEGIKIFIDALDEVMEYGANEQKKHLIQVLVEKALVYDKDRLAEQVCNYIQDAPRIVVTANRLKGVRMSTELIYDGKPQKRKFIRENLKIDFRKPRIH